MKTTSAATGGIALDFDSAILADAAYRILLSHGLGDKWLEIELELWHTMTEQVERLDQVRRDSLAGLAAYPKLEWLMA